MAGGRGSGHARAGYARPGDRAGGRVFDHALSRSLFGLRHRNKLAEVRDHRVWLVRIAWNLVLDRKRRAKTRPQTDDFEDLARVLPTGELSAERMVITAQRHARILRLIDTLPLREREVLLLSAVKELSTAEIALVLKTTESTIRSRLYRARHALAALLEQEGNLP
jgi:RNA polymerase sigma-70 factor (ECF subfamily)